MKKSIAMLLSLSIVFSAFGTTANVLAEDNTVPQKPTVFKTQNFTDAMKMPYKVDISPADGADSVERQADIKKSPYFVSNDYYNMTSSETLTLLPKFKTIQQTSEWSCGVTSAMMVLQYYGKLGNWNEKSLAALRKNSTPGATSLSQAMDIFNGVGGFTLTSTYDFKGNMDEISLEMIQDYLKNNTPVMIAWNDWGGHWQVIIGYDTMGTETTADDVLIVADPYDTTDHNQDGYGVYPAERFFYNWTMYNFFENDMNDKLFLAAVPETK